MADGPMDFSGSMVFLPLSWWQWKKKRTDNMVRCCQKCCSRNWCCQCQTFDAFHGAILLVGLNIEHPFFNGHLTGTLLLPYMVLTYLHWSWRSPIDGSARSLGMGWFSPCPLAPGTMRRGTMRNSLGAKKPGDQGRYKGWVVVFFVIADDLKLLGCWSFSWGSTKIAWNEGKRPKIRQQRWN